MIRFITNVVVRWPLRAVRWLIVDIWRGVLNQYGRQSFLAARWVTRRLRRSRQ